MNYKVFTAIFAGTYALSAVALSGTMRVNFNASVTVQPQVNLTNAYMVFRGQMYTKGAPFDQILEESHATITKVLSLGNVPAGSNTPLSTTFVASTYSSASYVGQPASAMGLDLGVLIVGTYGAGDTLGEGNGVVIGYEPIAGNDIIQAGASWNGTQLPMFVPTSTTAGTLGFADHSPTEASLFHVLRTGTPAEISWALLEANLYLSHPMNEEPGESGIGIPYYSYLETSANPGVAARYHRNQKFVDRAAKLVRYSPAADGGDAVINVSDPLPNLLGDFDGDGVLLAADIDLLLRGSNVSGAGTRLYDVNDDSIANLVPNTPGSDADVWVRALKSTEYGDANLDGRVNFDDLLMLAHNYGRTSGVGWHEGDFDGDSAIKFDDLFIIAQHYGFGEAMRDGFGTQLAAGSGDFPADWALARSLVPEPASLLSVTLALGSIARRRR